MQNEDQPQAQDLPDDVKELLEQKSTQLQSATNALAWISAAREGIPLFEKIVDFFDKRSERRANAKITKQQQSIATRSGFGTEAVTAADAEYLARTNGCNDRINS